MARKNVLKYERLLYAPEALESGTLTVKEQRAEYSRLRKIANSRISALGRSEFRESQTYLKNRGGFAPLSKIESKDLKFELYDLMKFVTAKSSSVTGQREIRQQTIATFHDMGYTFINRKNYKQFTDFMENARKTYDAHGRKYSNTTLELFSVIQRVKMDPEIVQQKFSEWVGDSDKIRELQKIISADINGVDAEQIREMIDRL